MGIFSFLTQEIAIDLGTANTLIIWNDKVVVDEPSIVAKDIQSGKIVAIEDIQVLLEKQMKKGRFIFNSLPENIALPDGAKNKVWHNTKLTFDYIGPINNLIDWMEKQDLIDAVLEEPDLESIFMNYYQR